MSIAYSPGPRKSQKRLRNKQKRGGSGGAAPPRYSPGNPLEKKKTSTAARHLASGGRTLHRANSTARESPKHALGREAPESVFGRFARQVHDCPCNIQFLSDARCDTAVPVFLCNYSVSGPCRPLPVTSYWLGCRGPKWGFIGTFREDCRLHFAIFVEAHLWGRW